jgi:hypothetical protein
MVIKLVQNTCTYNKRKKNHNYLKNVPSKKRGHLAITFNNILHVVTKDNNIFELQGLLEHNDFISKPTTRIIQMLYYVSNKQIEY